LQSADKLRLEFIGSVVHEMRSPLASVLGYTSFLNSNEDLLKTTEASKYIAIIHAQAQRISELIDDMLTATQAQFARLSISPNWLQLDLLLTDVVEECARQSRREIVLETKVNRPAQIMGDPLRLRQVFLNLIENAVKFSASSTTITVRVQPRASLEQLEVSVTDSGIGIAEADYSKLFKPFGRIRTSQTRGVAGSGLGLYIIDQIIRLHGGTVTVTSKEGEGSVFSVSLPWQTTAIHNDL
jgi:signal transduction histidine kinase